MTYASRTQTYQQIKPCIAPGTHKFVVGHPPLGQWGYSQIVCERCGMTRSEAAS